MSKGCGITCTSLGNEGVDRISQREIRNSCELAVSCSTQEQTQRPPTPGGISFAFETQSPHLIRELSQAIQTPCCVTYACDLRKKKSKIEHNLDFMRRYSLEEMSEKECCEMFVDIKKRLFL
ncbi:hypothetical protein NPIL_303551 [Nephila pilipes]|uniref:Uncharacterized protein n=1 Tax=Nephila pilipes TaxID=299642 RepID=A0A8X6QIT3_NEPPI|nr:hypothetical protein NPIL_303551 [Nephila pilipes]